MLASVPQVSFHLASLAQKSTTKKDKPGFGDPRGCMLNLLPPSKSPFQR